MQINNKVYVNGSSIYFIAPFTHTLRIRGIHFARKVKYQLLFLLINGIKILTLEMLVWNIISVINTIFLA